MTKSIFTPEVGVPTFVAPATAPESAASAPAPAVTRNAYIPIPSGPVDTDLHRDDQVPLPVGSKLTPAQMADRERVPYVLPGEGGGKMIRHRTGQVTGPIGGEALRMALARGAVIVGDVPLKVTLGKSVPDQQNQAQRQEAAQQRADKASSLFNPADGASGYTGGGGFTPRT